MFVDLWDGNQTNTAKAAGYRDCTRAGYRCARHNKIKRLIRYSRDCEIKPQIADRKTRQQFWSDTMTDESEVIVNRLKASDLLGKSEGDFILRHEIDGLDSTILRTILANLPPLYALKVKRALAENCGGDIQKPAVLRVGH